MREVAEGDGSAGDGRLSPGVVEVEETGGGRYSNRIRAAGHVLAADEPPELGGGDTGPTPEEYLLAALGGCTSMTLRMYAERKNMPLRHVHVRLEQRKLSRQERAECENYSGQVTEIKREIELHGELTPEQRERLLEIANKCPVHRTLTGLVKVDTRLVD